MKYLYKSIGFDAIAEPVQADVSLYSLLKNQVKVKILKTFPKRPEYIVPIDGHITWLTMTDAKEVQEPNDIMKEIL